MRKARNTTQTIACALLCALCCGARAHAQDRPLFPQGAPTALAPQKQGIEQENLSSGGVTRSLTQELLPTGLALGATLLVIVLARSAIQRFGGKLPGARRPQGVVEVLARYPVARGQQVVLLKVGRRVIVTHQGAQGMQALSEFSSDSEVADLLVRCEAGERAKSPFSFDALLRQSDKSFEGKATPATKSAPARGRALEARDALPAFMRDAEIETVDLTKRKRGRA